MPSPPAFREFLDQPAQFAAAERIPGRMREHRLTAGVPNPGNRLFEPGPISRHMPRFAVYQETGKHPPYVRCVALCNQVAGEMGPTDQGPLGQCPRPLESTRDARLLQTPPDFLRTPVAESTKPAQPFQQSPMIRIDAQPQEVHGQPLPGDGDLDTGDQYQIGGFRRRPCFCNTLCRIVIRQGQDIHARAGGLSNEFSGAERAVRCGRVGMQIVVQRHRRIVPQRPRGCSNPDPRKPGCRARCGIHRQCMANLIRPTTEGRSIELSARPLW